MSSTDGYSKLPGEEEDPPRGWPRPHRSIGQVGSVVLFVFLTLVAVFLAVAQALDSSSVQALIWFGAAVMFGHGAGLVVNVMYRPRQTTEPARRGLNDVGEVGLAFHYWRWPYYWLAVVAVCCAVAFVGFAIAAASADSITGVVMALVFVVLGLSVLWYVVTMLRLAPGVVVISSSGIYHRSLVFEHFVPWDTVTEVVARSHRTPWITVKALPSPDTRTKSHLSRFVNGTEGLPFMIIRAHWLGPNAVSAYLALSRYFYAPDQRSELASP